MNALFGAAALFALVLLRQPLLLILALAFIMNWIRQRRYTR